MFNTVLKSAFLALAVTVTAPSLAHADCEADLGKLEEAMAKPDMSADNKAALATAGEKASSAMRKDDDETCNKIVMDALAAAGAAPAATTAAPAASAAVGSLGDLSAFKTISADTLKIVQDGDLAGAKTRIKDLEKAWDVARPKLHAMNVDSWNTLDKAIDISLRALRAGTPDAKKSADALTALNAVLDGLQGK